MAKTRLYRFVWMLMPPTALTSLLSLLAYFVCRLRCLVKAQQAADGIWFGAWFFLAIEVITLVPNTLPYVLRIFATKPADRSKDVLRGDKVPTVDILVTCCNEDIDVILDTVRAACTLDYPTDRYRVFVCDDGASSELKWALEALPYLHLFYHARIKGPVKDYKAGNLNAGLNYSRSVPISSTDSNKKDLASLSDGLKLPQKRGSIGKTWETGILSRSSSTQSGLNLFSRVSLDVMPVDLSGSEYVAGLDADMIPEPQWLRTILPHLIDDPKMGLACPPQTFYDIPTNDPLNQTMDHFAGITEVVNDALGHADCLGSGYVLRRRAIDSIGGFPIESLSEDVFCSACLLGAGWKTAFVHERLQNGLVPESFFAHVKQRTRWFVGHVQTAMMFKLRFFGSRGKHLNRLQKIAGLAFDLGQVSQVPTIIAYGSIPFALLSNYPLVNWTSREDLRALIWHATTWLACHWIHQGVMGLIAGLGNGYYDMRTPSYGSELDQWLAPYIAESFFRSFVLPERLGGRKAGFTPSGSIKSVMNERDQRHRAPLHRRLYVTLFRQRLIIHVSFIIASSLGVYMTFQRALKAEKGLFSLKMQMSQQMVEQWIYLIVRVGWPPLIWLQYTSSAMSPILYTIFPPTTPDRESLLDRNPKTGVAYPTLESRRSDRNIFVIWRYCRPLIAMLYTIFLFRIIKSI